MFDGSDAFGKFVGVFLGGCIIAAAMGSGGFVLLAGGLVVWLVLTYYNNLERRDLRDENAKRKRRR